MSDKSGASSQVISLPKGGGALSGIGETFSPDLHTGTGNFTVPIALPSGRNGFQPELNLVYSTGAGNGPFGLGWSLSLPGVSRKTAKGVPRYEEAKDTFVLSGSEDLVAVEAAPVAGGTRTRYRPRTEGLFARIHRHHDADSDYWEVRSKDGRVTRYGTPRPPGADPTWRDPAVLADPARRDRIFAWRLTETRDPFGNRIVYAYERDSGQEGPRGWDQLYLRQIRYVDYEDGQGDERFLVTVSFEYEDLPERYGAGVPAARRVYPFSDYRAGFEIRTRKRAKRILIRAHAGQELLVRSYELDYLDERVAAGELPDDVLPVNGVSLLSRVRVVGHDESRQAPEERTEALPPLEFAYTLFEPQGRDFFAVEGRDLPARSLASPDLELADLSGNGLPDIVQFSPPAPQGAVQTNGTVRYWRNLGDGRFDLPREMREAPAGLSLADPGVQLVDADGDGRIDLLVSSGDLQGYFPLQPDGEWDRRSFRPHRQGPSFNLEDPEVRLVDLDGDGVTDAVRSGARLECFFNDPTEGWSATRRVERRALEVFPNVDFSDSRVRWADMSGDGLQDVVLVHDGHVEYWPSLGHGDWGPRVHMHDSPRFPFGYDPRRILIGDVDGDGLADLVYVDHRRILFWLNQSGAGWSDPIEIDGTPPVSDVDAVRLVDLLGTGVSGVLWSADANGSRRENLYFLDLTGGVKPYLLHELNNHMGALTRVRYEPSTRFYSRDERRPETRWRTPLPFPVQVVASVEAVDEISGGKLATEYRYHHGYWDGAERELRGFAMVEQLDTQTFETYNRPGSGVDAAHFSAPTLTRTWFHQGPVGAEHGDWHEADHSHEHWPGDPSTLERASSAAAFLRSLPRRARRDALRALRGRILRTELYALDGTERQDRPYTVTESCHGLREESALGRDEADRRRVFFPFVVAQRTTQWERGDEPMTRLAFTEDYDAYGQPRSRIDVAVPRWRRSDFGPVNGLPSDALPADTPPHVREHARALERYLATRTITDYARKDTDAVYVVDRVARATTYEIENSGEEALFALKASISDDTAPGEIVGQTVSFFDGPAFQGLPFGQIGDYGALARTETLALTDDILHEAYKSGDQVADPPEVPPYLASDPQAAWTAEYPQEFRDRLGALAGYTRHAGGAGTPFAAGYFAATERRSYDFQQGPGGRRRGLPVLLRDPLGNETALAYDAFDLLPIQVTDPAGLSTTADYDYRVLRPSTVTDPNGNRQSFAFTPLGLPSWIAVMGKEGEDVGDSPELPGARFEYDFLAFAESPPGARRPVHVRTVRRAHHVHDAGVSPAERDETLETVEYSDGFGRLVQVRTQGEDVRFGDGVFGGDVLPADQDDVQGTGSDVRGRQRAAGDPANVVVSGWQTYDNKGRVVEKYEPFFATGWDYARPGEAVRGHRMRMFYDPRGELVRTVNPDGSEQIVIRGVPSDLSDPATFAPTPWETFTYDENDNAGRTHPVQAEGYRHHWNTPFSIVIDALGRKVESVERNGPDPLDDAYVTRSGFDVRGNLIQVIDPLDRPAFRYVFDLADRPLRVESTDAGIRRMTLEASGNVVERRDGKGALILRAFDALRRPSRLWARDAAGEPVTLRERLDYGDGGLPEQDAGERDANRAANRLGRPLRHFDGAGALRYEAYDFKGNVGEKVRRVVSDESILSVFTAPGGAPPPGWQVPAFRVSWQPPNGIAFDDHADNLLDATEYRISTTFDALNRIRTMRYPRDAGGVRRAWQPRYNRAGALEHVELDGVTYVERIAYDAKGHRCLIVYGNGVMTRYAYDPETFRLTRMRTEHRTQPAPHSFRPTGALLQDYAYRHDLAGNVVEISDRTPGSGIPNTLIGPDALDRLFTFDPLYRLTSATGRESDIPTGRPPWEEPPLSTDVTSVRGYTEQYRYDRAGNPAQMRHSAGVGSFTHTFEIASGSNRLTSLTLGNGINQQTAFAFDANGDLVRENGVRHFEWDCDDRMKAFSTQVVGSEPSIHAHYLYDAGGQRVKKLVRHQGGGYDVTVYIDRCCEHRREVRANTARENHTLHLVDDTQRIATVLVGAPFPGDDTPAVKYHLGDHLGSGNVVLDAGGAWVNREEFFPYGGTSFGGFAKKRYRYSGKERDQESGLCFYGARYYAPWLARWISSDPAGLVDGPNLYAFNAGNPISRVDRLGTSSKPAETLRAEYEELAQQHGALEQEQNQLMQKKAAAEVDVEKHQDKVLESDLDPTDPKDQRKIKQREHNLRQAEQNLEKVTSDLKGVEKKLGQVSKAKQKLLKKAQGRGLLDKILGRRPDPDLVQELSDIDDDVRHKIEIDDIDRRIKEPKPRAKGFRGRGFGGKLRGVGVAIVPSILTYIIDKRLIQAAEVMESGRPPTEDELEVIQNWGYRFEGMVDGKAKYEYRPNLLQEIGNNWYMRFKLFEIEMEKAAMFGAVGSA